MIPSDPNISPPDGYRFGRRYYQFVKRIEDSGRYMDTRKLPFRLISSREDWYVYAKPGRGMRYGSDEGSVIYGGDSVGEGYNIILSFVGGGRMKTFWFINSGDLLVIELIPE